MRLHDEQRAKLRTPHEFKARPQTINLEDLYTPQELDLPDPTTGKKVQTVLVKKIGHVTHVQLTLKVSCLFTFRKDDQQGDRITDHSGHKQSD